MWSEMNFWIGCNREGVQDNKQEKRLLGKKHNKNGANIKVFD